VTVDEAYATCGRLAFTHYENFPVASHLLPPTMRKHVAAVYAYARIADDLADEGDVAVAVRHQRLDEWLDWLRASTAGGSVSAGLETRCAPTVLDRAATANAPAVFLALGHTIRAHDLPLSLFEDLVSAFRQDITVHRYDSWAALFDYCRRSANPVGRLVLRIAGRRDAALDDASDAVCTALQLTNFWQDLAIDWRRGRLYVPAEEHVAAGASLESLDREEWTNAWAVTLARCAQRTRALFGRGRPVADGVRGRLRWELRATWLGGMRILDRLERSGYDVFRERPTLGAGDVPSIAWRALWWRR
jgi:hydroxysqualene synthase